MASDFSEDDLIATLFAPIAGAAGLGLLDDAALIDAPDGMQIVATKDAVVAGVHFFPTDAPGDIARKALRVNISDLAAKGADPLGFLLAILLPPDLDERWLQSFAQALGEDARLFHCPLLGGDTVRTDGPLSLSITALGSAPRGRMARRTGAKAGDLIYVSGSIGDAALGLRVRAAAAADLAWIELLSDQARAHLLRRYLVPEPRLALAHAVRSLAHGAMDVSDGLAGDLAKMLRVSKVSGQVDLARMPYSLAAREAIALAPGLGDVTLTGGDDYEILCTLAPQNAGQFETAARTVGVAVTRIGEVTAGPSELPQFIEQDGAVRTFAKGSYSHF
ncbi:thiamine-phosphate kinase [Roseiarcaceae bacterium H3SJ34-1]|uniref:thiamine-phosphate kinase n=1 Tax=Terripilifer ovatus TaxID=3032367 RepID=UPI003AB9BB07|nr:thiamine-phosphate kinase [Roseiarcaceae bacterium H3SJ34-1]